MTGTHGSRTQNRATVNRLAFTNQCRKPRHSHPHWRMKMHTLRKVNVQLTRESGGTKTSQQKCGLSRKQWHKNHPVFPLPRLSLFMSPLCLGSSPVHFCTSLLSPLPPIPFQTISKKFATDYANMNEGENIMNPAMIQKSLKSGSIPDWLRPHCMHWEYMNILASILCFC